jgi:hypothetical protein
MMVPNAAGGGGGGPGLTVGATTISGGTNGDMLYDNAGVLGEQPIALKVAGGNLTFYVANTGSDSNNGTSALTPFATIQHAVIVAESFDYDGLYQCTINVANGTYHETVVINDLFQGFHFNQNPTGFLTGNTTTPANVVIAPNDASGNPAMVFHGGYWLVDGFEFHTDPVVPGYGILGDRTGTLQIGAINIVALAGLQPFLVRNGCRVVTGLGAVSTNINFSGTTGGANYIIIQQNSVWLDEANWIFNSADNLLGGVVYSGGLESAFDLTGTTWVNPGNITGGAPFNLIINSGIALGYDPTTVTLPGGAFDPKRIDGSCNIDGFLYGAQVAGTLVDESTIYRGSWHIYKDTNSAARSLAYDDGGVIYTRQIGNNINTKTANYTAALSDQEGIVEMNLAGAGTFTIPLNATVAFPIGTKMSIANIGTVNAAIAGAGGVTVHNTPFTFASRYSSAIVYKRATDEWTILSGAF